MDMTEPTQDHFPSLRRYLPERTWAHRQTGEHEAVLGHLRTVLQRVIPYLPAVIVRQRLAAPDGPAVSGRFDQATLLFADISGFTALSERLSQLGREGAEIITAIVNDYFAAMMGVITRHGGDLLKFGGDALLVAFRGEPSETAAQGCQAALEMQGAMTRFALLETEQGRFSLRMSAGLGTGTIFLASLGSGDKIEFAVMGPAVKRMAQAEHLAQAGEVVMDGATRTALPVEPTAEECAPGFYRLGALPLSPPPPAGVGPLSLPRADLEQTLSWLDALCPYLPTGVLERIIASPEAWVAEGEHRPATVLFANFYGIDPIIETLGPERSDEITAILNDHFTTMERVVHRYGGMVNKVDSYAVGYRIMAVFGAPVAHEDDPERAVRAALEMQAAMAHFARLPTSRGVFALKQRIGVNTGDVFAGNVGSILRQEYSVMGDEVNLASRLMGVAGEGEVLISKATAQQVRDTFELAAHEPVRVKGKSAPVRCYQVVRVAAGREWGSPQGALFGREEELGLALDLLRQAREGHGAVLDLVSEAGMGKSRLAVEVAAHARQSGMAVLRSEAASYGQGIPYQVWIELLQRLFGFSPGEESPLSRREKVLAGLERAGLSAWAPIVGKVLDVEMPETPLTASLDARLRQQRFFDVVLQLLQEEAGRVPALLILDNMQWADSISLELTGYVARNVGETALLLLVLHRPDLERAPWAGARTLHSLSLGPVGAEQALQLAQAVLPKAPLSQPLRRLVLDRAQGNPLFIQEIAQSLRESGAIGVRGEGPEREWAVLDPSVEVPVTLTGLLMSRLDRLQATDRRLLQVAGVIGMAFAAAMLQRIYPYGDLDGTLPERLESLCRRDLLYTPRPGEYAFRHTLMQEVAYASLPFARRRELHLRVGEEIERAYAEKLVEVYGPLAHHFDQARAFGRAFPYLVKAGDKARSEYANEAALRYYRRALELAEKEDLTLPDLTETVLAVTEAMGDVHLLVGHFEEAIGLFHHVADDPRTDLVHRADLYGKVAQAHGRQGRYEESLRWLEQARQMLHQAEEPHPAEMARLHSLTAVSFLRLGEVEAAISWCRRGLEALASLVPAESVQRDEASLYNVLGTACIEQGDLDRAIAAYRRSTDLRQGLGDLPGLAHSYNNLALVAWVQGDLEEAAVYLRKSRAIVEQIGDNHTLAQLRNNLGAVAFRRGNVGQALEEYRAALALRRRIGDTYGEAQSCSNIGEALASLGDHTQATAYLEQAIALFEQIGCRAELPEELCRLAEVDMARAAPEAALAHAGCAAAIARETGNRPAQGIAERLQARAEAAQGNLARAEELFRSSVTLLQEAGNPLEQGRSHYHYGLLLLEQAGRPAQAREHLRQAADLLSQAGEEKETALAQEALGRAVPADNTPSAI